MTATRTHLVVGAGQIGTATALHLAEAGAEVHVVTRSGRGPEHPNIERIAADASDPDTLRRLAVGAAAVYNCANPQYHRWPTDWPPLAHALLAAAESAGAPLVIAAPVYAYGPVDRPMTEDMPLAARTRKGAIRAGMWRDALAAYRAGRIPGVTEVRASDFIGPENSTISMVAPALRAGRTAWVPMPLDVPHSFSYVGDLGRALAALGTEPRAWGRAWHVPSPAPMTVREFVGRIAAQSGWAPPRLHRIPGPVLRAYGLANPFVRELREMRYQFERPFVLDASRTAATFGLTATDVDAAIRASLAAVPAPDTAPVPAR